MARRKTRRTPPRNAKGRFVKRSAAAPRRRHSRRRTASKRRAAVVVMANPRRRRRSYHRNPVVRRRRHSYRRNPVGFKQIFNRFTLESVAYTAGGIWGVPVLAGAINYVLPSSVNAMMQQNPSLKWVLKGASALGLYWLASKFISQKAGQYVLIGGLAYLGLSVVNEFAPQVMNPFGMGRYISGAGKQPLLAGASRYLAPGMRGPITQATPSRLSPASRF